jgi:TRAP-type mannitol/chloroaromatic compound transport system substrate-binding protein
MAAEYTHGNAMSLAQLQSDPNIEIRRFPDEVLRLLRSIAKEVVAELMANDPASAKVGKAYFDFLDKVAANSRLSEKAYLNARDV